jgi:hypothetical protein
LKLDSKIVQAVLWGPGFGVEILGENENVHLRACSGI